MADKAHTQTDQKLEQMEKHLQAVYTRAGKEVEKTAEKYFEDFRRLDEQKRKQLSSGRITEKEYTQWRQNKILYATWFTDLKQQIAAQMTHTNEIATAYINDQLPELYSLNYNALKPPVDGLGGYSFTLTDPTTIKNLAAKDLTLLPYRKIDPALDIPWNMKMIQAEVLQGIIQGDSIPKIAKRMQNVAGMNQVAAVRNARTMVTNVECKGRQDSYVQAQKDGVKLQKRWISTNDGRTRHAHRLLDGQIADIDEPFDSELGDIMFPGDPAARPANVYNCRCTIAAKILGFAKKAAAQTTEAVEKAVETVENRFPTIKEAEDYIKQFAQKVSMRGANNLDGINELAYVLEDLHKRFPLRQKLSSLTTNGRLKIANARANCDLIEIRTQYLNGLEKAEDWAERQARNKKLIEQYKRDYLGDPRYNQTQVKKYIREMEKEMEFSRWSVSSSSGEGQITRTISHEYGHVLADQIMGQINGSYANSAYQMRPGNALYDECQKVKGVYRKAMTSGDIHQISMYGSTNEQEFFAETFAMYATGEPLPGYIKDMIEEVLKLV